MLTVRDLTVEYRSGDYVVRPLDGFDLTADPGELVLLLGASGCGKTTLLSTLAGILTPKSGSVTVDGIEVTSLSGHDLVEYRRHRVGVVFQAFNLVPSLSALENVQAPLRVAGTSRIEARRRAEELLAQVDLTDRAGTKPSQMSGGQQQRVAIARALAFDPPLILADEPTAHLDFVQCEIVLRVLRDLAAGGRTVVISTHDDRLLPLADRVVELTPRFEGGPVPTGTLDVPAGATIFRQGAASDVVYFIESGEVEVRRELADGTARRLAVLPSGRYVGELGPLLGIQRSATAVALTDCVLRRCSPHEFRATIGRGEVNGNGSTSRPRRREPLRAAPLR